MARPVEYKILYDLLDSFSKDVIENAVREIGAVRRIGGKNRRRVASGTLQKSLKYDIRERGLSSTVLFYAGGKAADYGDVIEYGRRPNRRPPPYGKILEWIKTKGIKPRDVDNPDKRQSGKFIKAGELKLRKRKGKTRTTNEIYTSMAIRMAKSIGKKGIEGIYYFRDAIEAELDKRGPDFIEALNDAVSARIKAQIDLNKTLRIKKR